jgi:hypothetical protein
MQGEGVWGRRKEGGPARQGGAVQRRASAASALRDDGRRCSVRGTHGEGAAAAEQGAQGTER